MTTSRCSSLRSVPTHVGIGHAGLPLWAAIHWSRSSFHTPARHHFVRWLPCTSIWSNLHPIACCSLLLAHAVLRTFFKRAAWVIFSEAAIAASQRTHCCVRGCYVSDSGAFDDGPVMRLNSDSITPAWGGFGARTCCCGKVRKMITKSAKPWGIHSWLQVTMGWMTVILHILLTIYTAAYSWRLQGIPTVLRFGLSRSDGVCLFTGIHRSRRQR